MNSGAFLLVFGVYLSNRYLFMVLKGNVKRISLVLLTVRIKLNIFLEASLIYQ